MFKSITYLREEYDEASGKYNHYYDLVDSEFECEISGVVAAEDAAAVAAEYHKRNLPIIKNLYLLNNFLLNNMYDGWRFEDLIDYQNTYIDEYCSIPGINFSKDIYPKLLKIHEELVVFE